MRLLLVINRAPYDGTDVVWNALRLAATALAEGMQVWLFLINDGVDLAREGVTPEGAEFDLQSMLAGLIEQDHLVDAARRVRQDQPQWTSPILSIPSSKRASSTTSAPDS